MKLLFALLVINLFAVPSSFAAPKGYVSLSLFCERAGCEIFLQKPQGRIFIKNRAENTKRAIVSLFSSVAIVDDQSVEDDDAFMLEERGEFFLSDDLGQFLIERLNLKTMPTEASGEKSKSEERSIKTLVIDPGHGGNDFGTSIQKLQEKDISLIYALKLKNYLSKLMPSVNVIVTREEDRFVSLEDRAKLANASKADLFLSLHVNHAPDTKIFGAETYILSPNATDDEARKTALLENDAELKLIKEQKRSNPVLSILAEMEQTKNIQKSAVIAAYIQQELAELNKPLGLKNRGVKQALFYVLSQAVMPSVLVEMGFLSNSGDRKRLMDLKFQEEFVKRIAHALERYQIEPPK